jgi:hypothetical protein
MASASMIEWTPAAPPPAAWATLNLPILADFMMARAKGSTTPYYDCHCTVLSGQQPMLLLDR